LKPETLNSKLQTLNSKLEILLVKPDSPKQTEEVVSESPRFLRRLYAVVLGELAVLILLFYLFTKVFE